MKVQISFANRKWSALRRARAKRNLEQLLDELPAMLRDAVIKRGVKFEFSDGPDAFDRIRNQVSLNVTDFCSFEFNSQFVGRPQQEALGALAAAVSGLIASD